jgi:hypothetical protein
MAVDGVSPTLIPSKVMDAPEAKTRAPKKAKKDPTAPATEAAPTDAAPKGNKGKKRAASKGPEEPTGATPATEEVVDGEKVAGETSGSLIVAKAVRTLLKNHTTPIHLGSDALPALNAKVTELIYEAIGRSLANGRKTLKNSDF